MYSTLLKKITPQSLILTPSQALSNQLCGVLPYSRHIFPIHTYLLNLWKQSGSTKVLLSEFQEWQIWQTIIAESELGKNLLNIPNTAKLVQEAWTLAAEWNLSLFSQNLFFSDETNQFIEWSEEFKLICEKNNWLSSAQLFRELLLHKTSLKIHAEIIFVNFDKLNPQTQDFFDALKDQYTFIDLVKIPLSSQGKEDFNITCYSFPHFEAELEAMATWAKQTQSENPKDLIHCVVPELYTQKAKVERVFRKIFNTPIPQELAIDIVSHFPLSQAPLIKTALAILGMNRLKNSINDITEILLSPFILGNPSEFSPRSLLDIRLRELNSPDLKWQDILFQAEKYQVLLWAESIKQFLVLKEETGSAKKSLSDWAEYFKKLLGAVGWPGERTLSAQEIQEQFAWEKSLDHFIESNPEIDKKYSENQALHILQQLLNNCLFEANSPKSHIKIMNLNEAAQLSCHHRWICGLHNGIWPAMPRTNPFLPQNLQIEKSLPHSSYQNEFNFAKKITQRLKQGANTIIFSFPENAQDGALERSPLLKEFIPQEFFVAANGSSPCQARVRGGSPTCKTLDSQGRKFPPKDEDAITPGGSGILKSQSACPFQAFAKYRLNAQPLPVPSPYISHLDRGNLLHATLEYFWGQVQDQKTLLAYTETQLISIIQKSVDRALKAKNHVLQKCPEHWLTVEKHCLESLVNAWINVERSRPQFSVIAREKKQLVSLGNLNLKLTVDRIDSLENSDQVVIDYKTGQTKISKNSWSGDRPEEPQLPLYCLALSEIRGSIIAQVKASKPGFTGITAKASGIAGVETVQGDENAWLQTVEAWSQTLNKLADEFSNGYAAVEPRDISVCATCEFPSLCRINEK